MVERIDIIDNIPFSQARPIDVIGDNLKELVKEKGWPEETKVGVAFLLDDFLKGNDKDEDFEHFVNRMDNRHCILTGDEYKISKDYMMSIIDKLHGIGSLSVKDGMNIILDYAEVEIHTQKEIQRLDVVSQKEIEQKLAIANKRTSSPRNKMAKKKKGEATKKIYKRKSNRK